MQDEPHDSPRPGESATEEQAKDRYRELLEELRTIIPGAEVLLGFLLTVPFSSRFGEVDRLGAAIAMVALLAAGLATVLFLAPSAYHRVAEHALRTERVRFGVRTQAAGLVLTAAAVCLGVFVVVRFVFGTVWATAAAATLALSVLTWWVVVPLGHERRGSRLGADGGGRITDPAGADAAKVREVRAGGAPTPRR